MRKIKFFENIDSTLMLNLISAFFLLAALFLTFYPSLDTWVDGSFTDGLVSAMCLLVSIGVIIMNRVIPKDKEVTE